MFSLGIQIDFNHYFGTNLPFDDTVYLVKYKDVRDWGECSKKEAIHPFYESKKWESMNLSELWTEDFLEESPNSIQLILDLERENIHRKINESVKSFFEEICNKVQRFCSAGSIGFILDLAEES